LHHVVHTSHTPTHNSHHHTKLALLISQLLEGRTDFDKNEEKVNILAKDLYPLCV